ncbi:helix-turn-helix domain-containing protein [Actinocrinis puniceicyclus]|uniref:Helix-turn-helix domain-containing protein n=1 Tax=Actinocrinis puniceicyclus TaxID=977794 RepID=A0A8J7WPP5_9ACTN|nr:helix-turn-helix domain-containing protein [Actinocrinis puniceicyclus]MBS2964550.1 helix-turn-helix domain-containing protein [Actinocrinis puniceicyclus]
MTTTAHHPETSQTLDRGLRALEELADAPTGLTVTELADHLGVNRTIVYRLLATLELHGLARRDVAGRARLGIGVLALARRVQPLLRDAAAIPLRRLAEEVGATAHLTVVDGTEALAVAVVEPTWTDYHVAYRVGSRHALDRGAAGRAIVAYRDNGTKTFIVTQGELQVGAFGIAAPVVDVPGIEASVGVISFGELDPARTGPRIVRAAAEVAKALR